MKKITTLVLSAFLAGCATGVKKPLKTQLEVREFQTRTFETSKTNDVLSAVVEAFQDQGFMVKNVVPEVGLVVATKESDVEDSGEATFRYILMGANAMWAKNASVEATANVKTQGGRTRVRINFQEKIINNKGSTDSVNTIEDAKFYQMFFDKVGKSIFIERQKLS